MLIQAANGHFSDRVIVVLDGAGSFSVSPLLGFQEAKDLHEAMALWATLALFLGSNIGNFDRPAAEAFLCGIRAALRPRCR